MDLITADQMRRIEQAAIDSGAVTGLALMERAGAGVVQAIAEGVPTLNPKRAAVLCGPGNNGGDGFVIARLLHDQGWQVAVYAFGDQNRLPPDARQNAARWSERGPVHSYDDAAFVAALRDPNAPKVTLLIDAFLGIGLSRPATFCSALMRHCAERRHSGAAMPKIVAVDIPTGLNSDTGKVHDSDQSIETQALAADLTVTFHQAKRGHKLAHGPALCGQVIVKDIGL